MKILFQSSMGEGDVSTQRLEALERNPRVEVIRSPVGAPRPGRLRGLLRRLAWRARAPFDSAGENRQLLENARRTRPDAVIVYNSRVLRADTLRRIRSETGAILVYIAPDDIVSSHNSTVWLRGSFPLWDILFTSKSFNVEELRALGVRRPILNENIFDPHIHRPMTAEEVGEEYEKFDLVFVGTFERDREASLRLLAEAGFSVLVHGNAAGLLSGGWRRLAEAGVTVRPAAVHLDYTRAVHTAKVPLGFLRKMNRDLITHRSIELPAMGRAMLAEKTEEHDSHFEDGVEYVGFRTDEEMIEKARELIADPARRAAIGQAARERCFSSGYSVDEDMTRIVREISALRTDGA